MHKDLAHQDRAVARSHGRSKRPALTLGIATAAVLLSACASTSGVPSGTGAAGTGHTATSVRPPPSTKDPRTTAGAATRPARASRPRPSALVPLPPPAVLVPFHSASLGSGRWRPAGRTVQGHAAVYETSLLAPGASQPSGIAWMDPRLLRAQLYSGSLSPGGTSWKLTAPVSPAAARSLVAAFNGGFKFPAAEGGYYAEERLVFPLRAGGASLVIYRDGTATVGSWGRDVRMTPQVIAVRQNLTLLVDDGHAVAGLQPGDTSAWGATLGGVPAVWRSGVGVTASGALVYVTGAGLDITQLAALLVRAGCVRAMTLDMNPAWTVFVTYRPSSPQGLAAPSNGATLVPGAEQGPYTFFEPFWARDFVTMSAR